MESGRLLNVLVVSGKVVHAAAYAWHRAFVAEALLFRDLVLIVFFWMMVSDVYLVC